MPDEKNKKNKPSSSQKDYSQNFYKPEKVEKMDNECPQCHYHPEDEDEDENLEECPQCHYKFNKDND